MQIDPIFKDILVPAISAFIGALGPVAVILIQAKNDRKREIVKLATELALEERKENMELLRSSGGALFPMAVYTNLHVQVLTRLLKGPISSEEYLKILDDNKKLANSVDARGPGGTAEVSGKNGFFSSPASVRK